MNKSQGADWDWQATIGSINIGIQLFEMESKINGNINMLNFNKFNVN